MLVVHYMNDTRSQRILWLLEELGLEYEIKKYQRTKGLRAPPEVAAAHPLGRVPVVEDGAIILAESGAIVQYIIGKYGEGRGQPPNLDASKADDLYFTHYAEGTLMPLLVIRYIFTLIPGGAPFLLRPLLRPLFNKLDSGTLAGPLKQHANLIESQLEKTKGWFAGGDEPTAADYMMEFPLNAWYTGAKGSELGEQTAAYVQRIRDRPAFQRALEKGGSYSYA